MYDKDFKSVIMAVGFEWTNDRVGSANLTSSDMFSWLRSLKSL